MLASIIANANRDPNKRREPFSPEDFMPQRQPDPPKQLSADETVNFIAMLNRSLGGADLREPSAA